MTDEEHVTNEGHKIEPGEWVKTSLGTIGTEAILRAMGINCPVEAEDPEVDPSMELKGIATVNYLIGRLEAAYNILFDAKDYNPRMEDYLSTDARSEYDDAIRSARKAVNRAVELLIDEFGEQIKVLDVWKEKEGKE